MGHIHFKKSEIKIEVWLERYDWDFGATIHLPKRLWAEFRELKFVFEFYENDLFFSLSPHFPKKIFDSDWNKIEQKKLPLLEEEGKKCLVEKTTPSLQMSCRTHGLWAHQTLPNVCRSNDFPWKWNLGLISPFSFSLCSWQDKWNQDYASFVSLLLSS